MTSIITSVQAHRRGFALVGALTALVLAAVALLLFKTGQVHDIHHLVSNFHYLPQFVQTLLGAGRIGS